jgi:hypothetical protein
MVISEAGQSSSFGAAARLMQRLPSYISDIRRHPRWAAILLLGRFVPARDVARGIASITKPARTIPETTSDALSRMKISEAVRELRDAGICTGLTLPKTTVAAIRDFAETTPCYGNLDRRQPFLAAEHDAAEKRYDRRILVAHFLDRTLDCPAVREVAQNRWLHSVATGYFRAAPTLLDTRLWWSFPTTTPDQSELAIASQDAFHFDLDDWKQLKFFFYITDVGMEAGPHRFVRGSHARRPLSHQFSMFVGRSDEEITKVYGTRAIQTLTGPAGSGFAEDPFGYHTGTRVQSGRRLILEVSYGISNLTMKPGSH